MIVTTSLAPGIFEIAVVGAASNDDLRGILRIVERESEDGEIAMLANFQQRTARAEFIDVFYKHMAAEFAGRISKFAIVGATDAHELEQISTTLEIHAQSFDDKPSAIAWLKAG